MVYQLKHGKVSAPPASPTQEPPSSNQQSACAKTRLLGSCSNQSGQSSLVPYESDVSTDSDVENKDRSELERLLTKSSLSTKGWKVTEQDDTLSRNDKPFTTNWSVTEIKVPKLARNLSDTELDGRKKKKHKASGSDSEIDKISTKLDDRKKRTMILEKYKTNFGKSVDKAVAESEERTKVSKKGEDKT